MKRLGLALLVLVSGLGYLALMIGGWGSLRGFFSDPARTTLVLVTLGFSIVALFSDTSGLGPGVREDRSNRWVLLPLIGGGLVMVWLTPYLDRHNQWVVGEEAGRWVGVAVTLIGGSLRLAPVFALGRRFSGLVAIQEGHTLKTDGIYRIVRHPSYLGLLIGTFGWALVFRCVLPGLVLTAVMALAIVARMNSEEKLLADQFGDAYATYRKRTWRLIPLVY